MKILQLIYESPDSPYGFGGAGVRAHEIYKRLRDRHDITLLSLKYPNARDGETDGLKYVFVGTESRSLTKSVFAYNICASNFIRKNGSNFDVIIENFLPATPFFSKFLTKTPVILQVQGIMERHAFKKYKPLFSIPMYFMENLYPRLYDRFIFVSPVTQKKVLSMFRRKTVSSYLIPNGINEELLKITPRDDRYILFMSRIDIYTKGLDILIKAFSRIAGQYSDTKLLLAGYEFNSFHDLVSDCPLHIRKRIEYVGFARNENRTRLLSGAALVVLPSRHESHPVSVLEAAACEKPLIVSDIPELNFVELEGFGLSFPSGSVDGLAQKLMLLLDNPEKRGILGKCGRQYAGNFLWDMIALQFEEALRSVVQK